MPKLDPALVPLLFQLEGRLYRIQGRDVRPIELLNGGVLTTTVQGERITGPEIAWCLHYGNWPKFPLVNLSGDPYDLRVGQNIFPARTKRLRYFETQRAGHYYHPLSPSAWSNSRQCRENWCVFAAQHYLRDLTYVEQVEAAERELAANSKPVALANQAWINREMTRLKKQEQRAEISARGKPARPAPIEGCVWHWWEGEWLSVPEPCHVSDDYMVRCRAVKAGAHSFSYRPEYSEVWAVTHDGQSVPAREIARL